MSLLKNNLSRIKHLSIVAVLISLSYIVTGCDREEDDFIKEPTATSTVVTGYIKTPEGIPLANVPVSVDYKATGLFGSSLIHKAKGTTDKSGYYKIFFEANETEGEGIQRGYTFSVDLSVLSPDNYIIAQKVDYGFSAYRDEWSGKTSNCNLTIPSKKLVKVVINNNGATVVNGRFAVKNMFPYFNNDDDNLYDKLIYWDEPGKWRIFENVVIPQGGSTSLMLPCAVGVENAIQVVYLGDETVKYLNGLPTSDVKVIVATDKSNDEIEFDYFTPDSDNR